MTVTCLRYRAQVQRKPVRLNDHRSGRHVRHWKCRTKHAHVHTCVSFLSRVTKSVYWVIIITPIGLLKRKPVATPAWSSGLGPGDKCCGGCRYVPKINGKQIRDREWPELRDRRKRRRRKNWTARQKSIMRPCSSSDEIFPLTLADRVLQVNVVSKGIVQIFWVFLLLYLVSTMWLLMLIKESGHDADDAEDDEYHNCDYSCWERGQMRERHQHRSSTWRGHSA